MINLLKRLEALTFSVRKPSSKSACLLFDSVDAACDLALMVNGQWDGCNGVVVDSFDPVAVNTAASLVGVRWGQPGDKSTLLHRLAAGELIRRYGAGERNFSNANLRCAVLAEHNFRGVNLSYSKLSLANFAGATLRGGDLTAADLSEADLSQADLTEANLSRTNLEKANLCGSNLNKANLTGAYLKEANLSQVDLSGVNLSGADLRGACLDDANLDGANLTNTKIYHSQLPS